VRLPLLWRIPTVRKVPPAADSLSARRVCRARGITLIELMVVITILGMMMLLGATAYNRMSRSYKEEGAAAEIDVVLRQARTSSIAAVAPSFVTINTETRRIVPWIYKTAGLWHFESKTEFGETPGAHYKGTVSGGLLSDEGKIGKCIRLGDGDYIDVGDSADFDFEEGGYIEAYIRLDAHDGFVFCKEGSYALKVDHSGALVGELFGKDGSEESAHVKAASYKIVPRRWTKVAFAWDRQSTRLLVDDCLVGRGPGGSPRITFNTPLCIGRADGGNILGLVDEVRVMTVESGRSVQVPESCTIEHNTAPWNAVYFSPDGSLDMRYHAGPVSISFTNEKRIRRVSVSMLGVTHRSELENKKEKQEDE
jgi:prepilin-type N-terminal cleavage/methylation domain-containing protein